MKISIKFDLDNMAYQLPEGSELDRQAVIETLKQISIKILNDFDSSVIHDPNGNNVGKWSIEK